MGSVYGAGASGWLRYDSVMSAINDVSNEDRDEDRREDRSAAEFSAGCLFSGMGGLASGLAEAGFEIRWASDHSPHAAAAFQHRFPGVRYLRGDVRTLSVAADALEPVDVLAGGFPCQSFSQAGGRKGLADERGKLFYEIPRLISEWTAQEHPKMLLLENVPHLLYGADGAWFDDVRRALRQAGYWFRRESCWVANLREETGVPQDRQRLFLVAASREHFDYNPFTPPPPNLVMPA